MITFDVPGTPQQQGSKIAMANRVMIDANKKLKPWRAEVIAAAREAYAVAMDGDAGPIMGPAYVWARFYFARPKGHYGTGRNEGKIKSTAPLAYTSMPDADKLQRALGDALAQAGVLHDDRLIVGWDTLKIYARRPHTEVAIFIPGEPGYPIFPHKEVDHDRGLRR